MNIRESTNWVKPLNLKKTLNIFRPADSVLGQQSKQAQ